jgi:hypothetical protein
MDQAQNVSIVPKSELIDTENSKFQLAKTQTVRCIVIKHEQIISIFEKVDAGLVRLIHLTLVV